MSSENSGGNGGGGGGINGIMTTIDSEQPYFDFEIQRNVTVTVGQTGFLHCRVERLGDKDVSTIIISTIFLFSLKFLVCNMCEICREKRLRNRFLVIFLCICRPEAGQQTTKNYCNAYLMYSKQWAMSHCQPKSQKHVDVYMLVFVFNCFIVAYARIINEMRGEKKRKRKRISQNNAFIYLESFHLFIFCRYLLLLFVEENDYFCENENSPNKTTEHYICGKQKTSYGVKCMIPYIWPSHYP